MNVKEGKVSSLKTINFKENLTMFRGKQEKVKLCYQRKVENLLGNQNKLITYLNKKWIFCNFLNFQLWS